MKLDDALEVSGSALREQSSMPSTLWKPRAEEHLVRRDADVDSRPPGAT